MVNSMSTKIETARMILRLINEDDLKEVAELNSDPEVRKFFPDGVQDADQTAKRIKEFVSFYKEKGLPCFVIFDNSLKEFIGRCGFGPIETGEIEVGYLLHKKFWEGYASEALEALLKWASTNIDSEYIIAFAPEGHIASQRVMEKCGMEYYKDGYGHGVMCKFYRMKNK